MLRVTFLDTASRDAFANRFKIEAKVGDNQLDVNWHFLQFAKLDPNALDYDEVVLLTSDTEKLSPVEHEFIVKGNPETFNNYATVKADLGNGFYLVSSTDGTNLGDYVDNIEHNSSPVNFLGNVVSMSEMNPEDTDLKPEDVNGQWPRIRVVSRYRPLLNGFSTHELTYKSKPELIIMDSGIDFTHPEFDYPELEKENFYALPVFNGDFTDEKGHGTAVAAMAVGKNLGVAFNCKLVSMKIGGSGHNATLLELGYAIDALMNRISSNPLKSRIVNISWGIPRSSWLDAKVQSLMDAGVLVVCAAGNSGISVEDISPAGLDTVITVGSIDKYDIPSGFNNISPSDAGITTGHGLSLDIFAPGEGILMAMPENNYKLGSGTSFATPLVSGIAVSIASLYETFVPYTQLKEIILDSATKDALLFEDDRFSENQNTLAYLLTADNNYNTKENNMTSYLGVHPETGEPIVADLSSVLSKDRLDQHFKDDVSTFSIKFLDPNIESRYSQFFSIDQVTGRLSIAKPTITLPEEVKLEMVEFIGVAQNSVIKRESNILFFFNINPLYKDTIQSDISLALTNTNSISFYGYWSGPIK